MSVEIGCNHGVLYYVTITIGYNGATKGADVLGWEKHIQNFDHLDISHNER